MSAGDRLRSKMRGETAALIEAIEPEVRLTRFEIFGSDAPPFRSLAEAAEWVRQEARAQSKRGLEQVRAAHRAAAAACQRLGEMLACSCEPSLFTPYLAFRVPPFGDADTERVEYAIDSKLGKLKRAVAPVCQVIGFREADLVAYILAGEQNRLYLSPWEGHVARRTIQFANGQRFHRPQISMRLRLTDLEPAELRQFLNSARGLWPRRSVAARLTAREHRLWGEVHRLGGVPARSGAAEAWKRLAKRAGYPNGQAARVAYGRIRAKLSRTAGPNERSS